MVYLRRARDRAASTNASTDEHSDATMTVIILTLLYVIFNIPVILYLIYFVVYTLLNLPILETTYFEKYYLGITVRILPAINSMLNPVIYFWRMKPFRRLILRQDRARRVQDDARRRDPREEQCPLPGAGGSQTVIPNITEETQTITGV